MASSAVASKVASPPKSKARQPQQSRLVAVPKPNDEEFRKREDAESAKIAELTAAMTQLQEEIRGKQGGREEYNHKKADIRHKLDDLHRKISDLEEERKTLLHKISEQQEQSRLKRSQVINMKKNLEYETEEQIDEQLRDIEHYMITTSVSLQIEKDLVSKMQTLRKMKPLVRDYSHLESDARASESNKLVPLKGRLDIIRDELNKLRDRRREESARNQQLVEERAKSTAPVKDLLDQRTELYNELTERKKVLAEIRTEKRELMRRYHAYLDELRTARRDAEREEKRKNDLLIKKQKVERELENLEMADDQLPGMGLLQQTVAYVTKLVEEFESGKGEAKEELPSVTSPSSGTTPQMDEEFSKCIVPKSQREEEFYFAPSKKKGRRARKGAAQKKAGVISHDLHTLSDFAELEVEPPLTYAEAGGVLEKLKEKLAALEGRRSEFEEANRRKRDALRRDLAALEKQERVHLKAEIDEAAATATETDETADPAEE